WSSQQIGSLLDEVGPGVLDEAGYSHARLADRTDASTSSRALSNAPFADWSFCCAPSYSSDKVRQLSRLVSLDRQRSSSRFLLSAELLALAILAARSDASLARPRTLSRALWQPGQSAPSSRKAAAVKDISVRYLMGRRPRGGADARACRTPDPAKRVQARLWRSPTSRRYTRCLRPLRA